MTTTDLLRTDAPWLHLFSGTLVDTEAFLSTITSDLETAASGRVVVRQLRGAKCRTVAALYDEWSAALQFPLTFGENWDALRDCLADLAWLRADAVVLCLTDAGKLLDQAPAEQFRTFANVLACILADRNTSAAKDRARPLHLLVQATSAEQEAVRNRWAVAGLSLAG
jgi:hypothetical protein